MLEDLSQLHPMFDRSLFCCIYKSKMMESLHKKSQNLEFLSPGDSDYIWVIMRETTQIGLMASGYKRKF